MALVGAFTAMAITGTNRGRIDFILGHLGLVAIPLAVVAEVARSFLLWRAGRSLLRLGLFALLRLTVLISLALAWLAMHVV